jgi:hypothetical protein
MIGPALAGAAEGDWVCGDTAGIEVLAWLSVSDDRYVIDTQMGISGEGHLAYQKEMPEPAPLLVLSGPLATTFGALHGSLDPAADTPVLLVSGPDGIIMICDQGTR